MKNLGTNAQGNTQIQFEGTLLSIGTTELKNSNEKKYKIVNIEFADVNGVAQKSSAACYEGNYSKGIEVGKNYLCTATIVGNEVYIQMSHLEPNAGRASVSAFLAEAKDAAPIKVGVLNS